MVNKVRGLFMMYVLMWSVQGVLVHRLQLLSSHPVNTPIIVLAQDFLKLVISIVSFIAIEGPFSCLGKTVKEHCRIGRLYLIPAGLYMVYNNLTFLGLSLFEPSRYFVLMQVRIVVTGIVYSWFFPRASKLGFQKWLALILVMFGAMLREYPWISSSSASTHTNVGYAVVGSQILLSTTAGVANEKLLKKYSKSLSLSVQNIFMYSSSLLLNLLAIIARGETEVSFPITDLMLWGPVVVNGALLGLVTSMFLRDLNSVLKSVASAIELWVTTILSSLVFGYPMDSGMLIGIAVLSIGVVLFSFHANEKADRRRFESKKQL